jgi:hypothetical protein
MPNAKIEGTQIPTKIPDNLLSSPKTPNQSVIEKRNEIKAAPKIE